MKNNIQLNNEFRDKISKLSLNYSDNCFVFIDDNKNQSKGKEFSIFSKKLKYFLLFSDSLQNTEDLNQMNSSF